jgi:hypothetical protein
MSDPSAWRIHGGDMLVIDNRFHRSTDDANLVYVTKMTGRDSISVLSAASVVVNFGLARDHIRFGGFFNDGILDATLFFIFVFLAQVFCLYLYLKCLTFDSSVSFTGIWSLAFGRKFGWIGRLLVFLCFLDTCFGATAVFGDMLQQIFVVNWPDAPSAFMDRWFLTVVIPILIIFPVHFVSDFVSLRWFSYIGNSLLLLSVVVVVIDTVQQRDTFPMGPDWCWWTGNLGATLNNFQLTCCAPLTLMLPEVLRVMDRPTPRRVKQVIWIVFSSLTLVVVGTGFATYATYFRWVDYRGLLSYNFMDPHAMVTILLEVTAVLNLLLTVDVLFWWQARHLTAFFVPENTTWFADFLSGVAIILVTIMTGFAPSQVITTVSLVSLLPRSLMLYVLPPAFFLKFFRFRNVGWAVSAIVAFVFGLAITAGSMYWGVMQCVYSWQT